MLSKTTAQIMETIPTCSSHTPISLVVGLLSTYWRRFSTKFVKTDYVHDSGLLFLSSGYIRYSKSEVVVGISKSAGVALFVSWISLP